MTLAPMQGVAGVLIYGPEREEARILIIILGQTTIGEEKGSHCKMLLPSSTTTTYQG